jgi:hypothetical protein
MPLKKKPSPNLKARPRLAAGKESKPAEMIEQRLDEKAAEADQRVFAEPSLGDLDREARRKLMYG